MKEFRCIKSNEGIVETIRIADIPAQSLKAARMLVASEYVDLIDGITMYYRERFGVFMINIFAGNDECFGYIMGEREKGYVLEDMRYDELLSLGPRFGGLEQNVFFIKTIIKAVEAVLMEMEKPYQGRRIKK